MIDVRKEENPEEPGYPDAVEFLKHRAAFGAAVIGAGLAVGGCSGSLNPPFEGRTGGVVAVSPQDSNGDRAKDCGTTGNGKGNETHNSGADDAMDAVPPRLPGKAKIEPPRLPGVAANPDNAKSPED